MRGRVCSRRLNASHLLLSVNLHLGVLVLHILLFFFSSRRRHTRLQGDWSSDVCSSDLALTAGVINEALFSVIVVVMVVVSVLPAPLFKRSLAAVAVERQAAQTATPSDGP